MKLHIGIAGPIATEHIANLLDCDTSTLPAGYTGAPLTAVLIKELLLKGHTVSAFTTDELLAPSTGTVKVSSRNFNFTICPARRRAWRFNKWRLGRAVDGFAYERKQLINAINQANPDIIHAHWTYEFALAAIKTGIPHLITCHDAPAVVLRYTRSFYRAIRYLMARRVFAQGRHFTAVSPYMVNAIQHYTKEPIPVVPNPLSGHVLELGKVRLPTTSKRIGMVCNGWDDRKNPKPALQAFTRFRQAYPTAELHLFGYGFGRGERSQLWCEQQRIAEGIVFHGALPHLQLLKELNALDLLLHPALEESFGVVIAEAMALGLPIVAGKFSGAVPWVVGYGEKNIDRPYCSVLTDMSDPRAIVKALDEAFDHHYPQRSATGYDRAQKMFAPDVISNLYIVQYKQILQTITNS